MLIADLMKHCETCGGTGFTAGYEEVGAWKPHIPGKCLACQGYGHQLTELGQDVWDLYRPRIEAMIAQAVQASRR